MNISGTTMNIDTLTVDGKDIKTTIEPFTYHSAAAHNAIYRGKNLGTELTAGQSAAIRAGTFNDIYPGDYWVRGIPAYSWIDHAGVTHEETQKDGILWYILGLDYFYANMPHLKMLNHHAVVFPSKSINDSSSERTKMNSTATTQGGYAGSDFFTKHILQWEAALKATWGNEHLARYSMLLCNAVTDGKESGWANFTNRITDLLTLEMIGVNSGKSYLDHPATLPAAIFNNQLFSGYGVNSFLQNVASDICFFSMRATYGINTTDASDPGNNTIMRPFFLLY